MSVDSRSVLADLSVGPTVARHDARTHVLIVEADAAFAQLLAGELAHSHIEATIAGSISSGRDALRSDHYEIVIIGAVLPDGSGRELLEAMRSTEHEANILIFGDPATEEVRVRALQLGADDYIVKPCSPTELAARVLALHRRRDRGNDTVIEHPPLRIDLNSRIVTCDGVDLGLTPKEFSLLAFLAARPGHAFAREELLRAVWHSAADWQQVATVTEHISRIRTKLAGTPSRPKVLTTIRSVGYQFDPPPGPTAVVDRGNAVMHIDGTILWADATAASLLGTTVENLSGQSIFDLVAPGSRAAAKERLDLTAAGRRLRSQVWSIRREDGSELAVQVASFEGEWDGRRAGRLVITPVPHTSDRLRQLATGVLAELSDAVIVMDLEGHIESWNRSAERLYGWSEHEVLGRHIVDVLPWANSDIEAGNTWMTLEATGRWHGQGVHLGRDGSLLDVSSTTTIFRGDDGLAIGVVSVNRLATTQHDALAPVRDDEDRDEIRRALDRDEFDVHFQPVVDLMDGHLVLVEALARWNHPDRGILAAAAFVDAASALDLMPELGRVVMAKAFGQVAVWRQAGRDIELIVNLSLTELQDPGLVARITETLRSSGLEPTALWIDVTETSVVEDAEAAQSVLRELVAMGVRLAVDDFGQGWSSVAYLRELGVGAVKIDQSVVARIARNPQDVAAATAIIALAQELGAIVVAKGIESVAQERALRALGCTIGQGYRYGRPVPSTAIRPDGARSL